MRDFDDEANDRLRLGVGQRGDQRLLDLDLGDGQLRKQDQGRIARAEIIQRQGDSGRQQLCDVGIDQVTLDDLGPLDDFQPQHRAGDVVQLQQFLQAQAEVGQAQGFG